MNRHFEDKISENVEKYNEICRYVIRQRKKNYNNHEMTWFIGVETLSELRLMHADFRSNPNEYTYSTFLEQDMMTGNYKMFGFSVIPVVRKKYMRLLVTEDT